MTKVIKNQMYSYWELKQYFSDTELLIIGSGIVGLSAAISYREQHPKASIVVLERGMLPLGASTKNGGFACFGSASELLADLKHMDESRVWDTVEMRYKGLKLLKKRLGKKAIAYKEHGGFELFDSVKPLNACLDRLSYLNKQMASITGVPDTYVQANEKISRFGFNRIKGLIHNRCEGQLDTALMMQELHRLAVNKNIKILNGVTVKAIHDLGKACSVETSLGELNAPKVLVATNGFAAELLKLNDIVPARSQVLITHPIKGLPFKGTFHYQEGYYYFRNIDGRVLLGGGRNLDFATEKTSRFELNPKIQQHLDQLLKTVILPGIPHTIDHRWCGIMGVGSEKKPIIQHVSPNVLCAVRMGGMGVAIGSLVGQLAAERLI